STTAGAVRMVAHLHRHLGKLAGSRFALLVALFCLPSAAQGSCGDHVKTSLPSGVNAGMMDGQPSHPAPSRQLPCSGPFCSSRSAPSLPLAVVVVTPEVDPSLSLAVVPRPEAPLLVFTLHDGEQSTPIHHGSTIYHPPRLVPCLPT